MLISMNWIKDFVNLDGINNEELVNRFVLSTAEIERVIDYGKDIKGVVTAKIIDVEKHPESNKLHKLTLDLGTSKNTCLCGAPNVEVGKIVAYAQVGSMVKGISIEAKTIAGVQSNGMCLSEKEMGISENHDGIYIFDPNTPLGVDVKTILEIEDTIWEIDNKSLNHRPDLWGHYGIAREIAAITGKTLEPLKIADLDKYSHLSKLDIKIEDKEKCYRYTSIAIKNITKKTAKVNMRIRLFYCGLRAINLLADLTNYIMLELGQPMHAFDRELVESIRIKTLPEGTQFKTLDGTVRKIYEDTLMICNEKMPIAIAGIMGGENTEIKDTTGSLLLESANFNGTLIRKSSTKLCLRTDASTRYEKMLDPELTKVAASRYVLLLNEADENIEIVSSLTDEYAYKFDEITIKITGNYIRKSIGMEVEDSFILNTLEKLCFDVEKNNDDYIVKVPSYRATKDIAMAADLVEEIARIYGYDNIVPMSKASELIPVIADENRENDYVIKRMLGTKYGLSEVHTYVWYDSKLNKELNIKTEDNIKITNSLNANDSVLRSTMMPSLIQVLNNNNKYASDTKIFEIGRVFQYNPEDKKKNCIEKKHLGIVLSDENKSEKELYYNIKGIIETVFLLTKNVKVNLVEGKIEESFIHPVNSCVVEMEGRKVGYISVLHPVIKDEIDKKLNVVIAEIDLDELAKVEKKVTIPNKVSKYQEVTIDLSLLVPKTVKYLEIEDIINNAKIPEILKYKLVDIYESVTLKDKRSITIGFTLGSYEKTLVSEEINNVIENLITAFEQKGIEIRR